MNEKKNGWLDYVGKERRKEWMNEIKKKKERMNEKRMAN